MLRNENDKCDKMRILTSKFHEALVSVITSPDSDTLCIALLSRESVCGHNWGLAGNEANHFADYDRSREEQEESRCVRLDCRRSSLPRDRGGGVICGEQITTSRCASYGGGLCPPPPPTYDHLSATRGFRETNLILEQQQRLLVMERDVLFREQSRNRPPNWMFAWQQPEARPTNCQSCWTPNPANVVESSTSVEEPACRDYGVDGGDVRGQCQSEPACRGYGDVPGQCESHQPCQSDGFARGNCIYNDRGQESEGGPGIDVRAEGNYAAKSKRERTKRYFSKARCAGLADR